MRVAIYGRVSTGHQVEHQTIEQQLERLTAHVHAHAAEGWALDPAYLFRDDGYSGAMLARPGLDRLRDAVRGREVDRVLVTAPDRLARNYVHQMVLLEEWARAGCCAEFLDRPMSDDPHDHLLLQIRGAVAEYERTLIAERMRRGRLAKLRAGVLLPWTYAPYGYRVNPDRPRDPRGVTTDPAEAAVVAELFAMYREPGTSLTQLAVHLDARGVPNRVLCLYFMGLNLSNRQISMELGLSASDVQAMTEQLRRGLVAKTPELELNGEVEIDEVYVVAGHKGQPAAVAKGGGAAGGAS